MMTNDHLQRDLRRLFADKNFVHYVMRFQPQLYGVYGIMAKLRKDYFVKGTPHSIECQLNWIKIGEEEWTIVSLLRKHSDIMLGLIQATGMEMTSSLPFDPGVTGCHIVKIWRSDEASLDSEILEQEKDIFIQIMTGKKT